MDNGIYVALSRQLALFRDMEMTANNLANASTTGYHSERILFNSYLTKDISRGQPNPVSFAHNASSYRNLENGSLRTTGNDLDVAIEGEGYFAVETPLGERYTRAGNFRLDDTGTLVNADGYPVLDSSNQRITVPPNVTSIVVGEAGNLKVNDEDAGSIGVVRFASPHLLERQSSNLFKSEVSPQPAERFRIAQGMLENSNVQPVTELTRMMKITHAVANTAKFVETVYDLERKAANAWAKQ